MSDPLEKKPCKTSSIEFQSSKKQRILVKSLRLTADSYISQFITYIKGLLSNKQLADDNSKEIKYKTDEKIKEVYKKFRKEVKAFQENDLRVYQHYSKKELEKVEIKLKEYSIKIKNVLTELFKFVQALKIKSTMKLVTNKDIQNLITYFKEKIDQTKKLTQDMMKTIQETVKEPQAKRKLMAMVETNYRNVTASIDALYTSIKETSAVEEHKCMKSGTINGKSFHSISMSYVLRIVTYVRGFLSERSDHSEIPIHSDVKTLLLGTEVKIKELYNSFLEKVQNLHENELQAYKNYSREELAKVKSYLQKYSIEMLKLAEDMLERLKSLRNQLQKRMITHENFQNLISYFEDKINETKKLTEEVIANIRATIKEPPLGKKLEMMVEINSQRLKVAMDNLYITIKNNITKSRQLISFDKNSLFSKMPNKTSIDWSPKQLMQSNESKAATMYGKGNEKIGLHRERIPLFNFSKHFNSQTIYGRTNVAKATYAGIFIYYIYTKMKNTKT